ncbi:hypothetical protein MRB53_037111 [Persea americana]|nr:hypothetical protein MRB53_037111 [Persea americana]
MLVNRSTAVCVGQSNVVCRANMTALHAGNDMIGTSVDLSHHPRHRPRRPATPNATSHDTCVQVDESMSTTADYMLRTVPPCEGNRHQEQPANRSSESCLDHSRGKIVRTTHASPYRDPFSWDGRPMCGDGRAECNDRSAVVAASHLARLRLRRREADGC